MEPLYILTNLSNFDLYNVYHRHYSRAAFDLVRSYLINVIFQFFPNIFHSRVTNTQHAILGKITTIIGMTS